MTRSHINPSYESGKWMKVKVAKWCCKKWNGPFLMHIYDKQCEIIQKNQCIRRWAVDNAATPTTSIIAFFTWRYLYDYYHMSLHSKELRLWYLKTWGAIILYNFHISLKSPCALLSKDAAVFLDFSFYSGFVLRRPQEISYLHLSI